MSRRPVVVSRRCLARRHQPEVVPQEGPFPSGLGSLAATSHLALSHNVPSALVIAACEARSSVDEGVAWNIRRSFRDEDGRDQTLYQTLLRRWSTLTPEQPAVSAGAQRSISAMLAAAYLAAAAVDDGHVPSAHHRPGQLERALMEDTEGLTGPMALLAAHALLHAPEGARCDTELLDPFLPDALRTTAQVETLPDLQYASASTLAWRATYRFSNPKQLSTSESHIIPGRPVSPQPPTAASRLLGTVAWKQAADSPPVGGDTSGAQRYSLEYLDDTCNKVCTRRDGSVSAVWVMPSLRSLTHMAAEQAVPLWLGLCCMTMVARSFEAGEAGRAETLGHGVLDGPSRGELTQLLQSIRQSTSAPFQTYFGDDLLAAVFKTGSSTPEHHRLKAGLDACIQEAADASPTFRSWTMATVLSIALGSGLPTSTASRMIAMLASSGASFIDCLSLALHQPSSCPPEGDLSKYLGTQLGTISRHASERTRGLLPGLLERSIAHLAAVCPSESAAADAAFLSAFDGAGGCLDDLWGLSDGTVLRLAQAAPAEGRFAASLAAHAASAMDWVSNASFRLTGERKKRPGTYNAAAGPLPAHRMAAYLPPVYCSGELFSIVVDKLVSSMLLDRLLAAQCENPLGRFLSAASPDGLAAGCVPSGAQLDAVMAIRTPHSSSQVVEASMARRGHAHALATSLEACCVALCAERALLTKQGIGADSSAFLANRANLASAVGLTVALISRWGVRAVATPARGVAKRNKGRTSPRPSTRSHKQELVGTEFPSLILAKLTTLLIASPDLHTRLCGVRLGNSLLVQDRVVATQWNGRTVEQMYQLTKLFSTDSVSGPTPDERQRWASQLVTWKELYKASMVVGSGPSVDNPIKERLLTASLQYMAHRGGRVNPTHQALAAVAQELYPSSYRRAAGLIASGRGFSTSDAQLSTDAVVIAPESVLVPFTLEATPHLHHAAMEQAMIVGPTSLDAPPHIIQQEKEARRQFWGGMGMGGIGGGGLYVAM